MINRPLFPPPFLPRVLPSLSPSPNKNIAHLSLLIKGNWEQGGCLSVWVCSLNQSYNQKLSSAVWWCDGLVLSHAVPLMLSSLFEERDRQTQLKGRCSCSRKSERRWQGSCLTGEWKQITTISSRVFFSCVQLWLFLLSVPLFCRLFLPEWKWFLSI